MAKKNENDATTTKSGIKRGANIVEQLDSEKKLENLENSKGFYFSHLSDYFFSFDAVTAEEKVQEIFKFSEEQLKLDDIQNFIAARVDEMRKKAIEDGNGLTVDEFRTKFESFTRSKDFSKVCGYSFEAALKAIITPAGVKIYHSISEGEIKDGSKKQAYEVETIKKTTLLGGLIEKSIWVEILEVNTINLLKGLRYFAVYDAAVSSVKHQARKADKPFYDLETALFNCSKAVGLEAMKDFISSKIEKLS